MFLVWSYFGGNGGGMGRKAKHHYIPKCYLKGFANGGDNSSSFWAVPKNKGNPFSTTPNDACAQRDYYTVEHNNSLIVEDFYAEQIEPKIGKVLNYIAEYSRLPPKEDMKHLILLLATLYLRVPSYRKSLEVPMLSVKRIVESISNDIHVSNIGDFDYSKTDLIGIELKMIDTVQKCLSNKYYQLYIVDDENVNVLTSDNPFILSHPEGRPGFYFGLNTPRIEICVPISSKAILIAKNERINEGTFKASKEIVGLTNFKVISSADRYLYSTSEEVILVDDDLLIFSHNIRSNSIKLQDEKGLHE
ncbi:DUF4238 domain-containing protein [Aeromonas veronii]|uniref:DUF4238 domain-containing protein n=1 Tax=Aeromonas veronii TaxID=654 RepID=UPI003D253F5B